MDLSVVIVNYNVRYFLDQCLQSVYKSGQGIGLEVFVVDNNSVDGSADMVREKFPQVTLIANKENLGFSRANNQAIRQAKGRYVLLLNPDTVVEDDTFSKVLSFMDEHPDAGGLGVKMLDGRGQFLPESKRGLPTPSVAFYKIFGLSRLFPRSRTFGRYHLGYLDKEKTHKVEVLSGAFMLLRAETLKKTGLLDEDFFMYGEDIDLSYRITKGGYNNYYYPGTRIIHYKGESTKKSSINYVFVFYQAMIIFARKHFSQNNAWLFSLLIKLAVYFRASLSILYRFLQNAAWPLADAALIYTGVYLIKDYWEHHVFMVESTYYPPFFMQVVVPAYLALWLFGIYISGGYDRPLNYFRIIRGVALGTVAILVIYALLPIHLRFSRALILLGSVWALIALPGIRYLALMLFPSGLRADETTARRVLIVGNAQESQRISGMLRQAGHNAFIGHVHARQNAQVSADNLGPIERLHEIIEIYRIQEVVFCAADLSSQAIIDHMSGLRNLPVNFKIAPPESLFIIGSNSIDTFGEVFTVDIGGIRRPAARRSKRLFDLAFSLFILPALPIHMLLVESATGLVKNLFKVLLGRCTWVGYHPGGMTEKLPPLKKSVIHPDDAFSHHVPGHETINHLNTFYAREYRVSQDLHLVMKAYRKLGRKPA